MIPSHLLEGEDARRNLSEQVNEARLSLCHFCKCFVKVTKPFVRFGHGYYACLPCFDKVRDWWK